MAREFELALMSDVAKHLREDGDLELRRSSLLWRTPGAYNVVSFANSNKWSPLISVAFYYGRRFDAAFEIEKSLNLHPAGMHVSQFSVNRPLLKDLGYSGPHGWEVDIRDPPINLSEEIAGAIRGIAYSFFERYSDIRKSRDALEHGDGWCFGANPMFWNSMLYLDAAIGELDHFEKWMNVLPAFYQEHAKQELARLRAFPAEQSNKPFKNRRQ